MFNNISNKKNKSRKDFLQKELEFYTNLLAQHEKKEKNLPCTSTFFIQRPTCSSKPMFTFNKVSDLKNTKEKNPLIQTTVIHNSSSKMTVSKHHLKKVMNGSQLDKSNSSSIIYNTKKLALSNAGVTTKLLMNQEASKKSKTLMGEIKAVTEQLKSKNSSRFKKINSLVKVEGKKDLQNIKQSSIKNNSYSNLNKVVSSMGNVPKLLYTENNAHRQKGNLKSHTVLLEKMNAVKNLLNATTKNSANVLNKAKKNLLENKTKLNYNNCRQKFVKSSNLSASQSKNLSRPVDKFLQKQDFRLNRASNNFPVQKSLVNQMSKESIKTQYKVVNKGLSPSRNVALQTHISSTVLKNCRLGNTPRSCSKRIFVKSVQSSFSPPKKTPNKVCKKYSPHFYRSAVKHRQNPTLNKSYKLSKSLLENVVKSPNSSTGVDVDLLLELAAENKKKLSKSRKRLYKSKNRLINSYSVQGRTVKMIKAKYFNPYKKFADSKYSNKSFKGYRSDSNISKSGESFLPKLKYRKCPQKKIVNLGIKSTKLSSHRKSFIWKPVIKTLSPVSKMMASRALNRSINQATRKKMQKINSYCMFYNRFGRCNKGIKCAFVHDPSKIAVCTRFLRGTCKSEKCLFSHEINPGKMALCSFFLQNACTKKDCPYLHEQLSSDAELCKAFVQGYCPNGKTCKKAHILICTKFLRGQCDKGKDCIFPHPVKKEILINPKSCSEEKDEFQLETVLRYFESNPQESLSLVVPSRVKSLPQQQDFISLEKSATLFYF